MITHVRIPVDMTWHSVLCPSILNVEWPFTVSLYKHLISLSKLNLPLLGTFTWPTPPGPYRATTCRGRELKYGEHRYFFDHTRTWRTSPDEWSAQCPHPTQHKHQRNYTSTHSVIPTRLIWNDDDDGQMILGDLGGLKFPDMSYRWGKTPKKPPPEILSRPGIEPGLAA